MASPLARASAIDLLEEAVDALRAAPLATLVCHSIGSVPFALALLIFWNDMTRPGARDATCATEALTLALLLAWMNCWRAVFAGRIQRQLDPDDRPELGRLRLLREPDGAVDAVAIGERHRLEPELDRPLDQLFGVRRALKEGEVRAAMQLGVARASHG